MNSQGCQYAGPLNYYEGHPGIRVPEVANTGGHNSSLMRGTRQLGSRMAAQVHESMTRVRSRIEQFMQRRGVKNSSKRCLSASCSRRLYRTYNPMSSCRRPSRDDTQCDGDNNEFEVDDDPFSTNSAASGSVSTLAQSAKRLQVSQRLRGSKPKEPYQPRLLLVPWKQQQVEQQRQKRQRPQGVRELHADKATSCSGKQPSGVVYPNIPLTQPPILNAYSTALKRHRIYAPEGFIKTAKFDLASSLENRSSIGSESSQCRLYAPPLALKKSFNYQVEPSYSQKRVQNQHPERHPHKCQQHYQHEQHDQHQLFQPQYHQESLQQQKRRSLQQGRTSEVLEATVAVDATFTDGSIGKHNIQRKDILSCTSGLESQMTPVPLELTDEPRTEQQEERPMQKPKLKEELEFEQQKPLQTQSGSEGRSDGDGSGCCSCKSNKPQERNLVSQVPTDSAGTSCDKLRDCYESASRDLAIESGEGLGISADSKGDGRVFRTSRNFLRLSQVMTPLSEEQSPPEDLSSPGSGNYTAKNSTTMNNGTLPPQVGGLKCPAGHRSTTSDIVKAIPCKPVRLYMPRRKSQTAVPAFSVAESPLDHQKDKLVKVAHSRPLSHPQRVTSVGRGKASVRSDGSTSSGPWFEQELEILIAGQDGQRHECSVTFSSNDSSTYVLDSESIEKIGFAIYSALSRESDSTNTLIEEVHVGTTELDSEYESIFPENSVTSSVIEEIRLGQAACRTDSTITGFDEGSVLETSSTSSDFRGDKINKIYIGKDGSLILKNEELLQRGSRQEVGRNNLSNSISIRSASSAQQIEDLDEPHDECEALSTTMTFQYRTSFESKTITTTTTSTGPIRANYQIVEKNPMISMPIDVLTIRPPIRTQTDASLTKLDLTTARQSCSVCPVETLHACAGQRLSTNSSSRGPSTAFTGTFTTMTETKTPSYTAWDRKLVTKDEEEESSIIFHLAGRIMSQYSDEDESLDLEIGNRPTLSIVTEWKDCENGESSNIMWRRKLCLIQTPPLILQAQTLPCIVSDCWPVHSSKALRIHQYLLPAALNSLEVAPRRASMHRFDEKFATVATNFQQAESPVAAVAGYRIICCGQFAQQTTSPSPNILTPIQLLRDDTVNINAKGKLRVIHGALQQRTLIACECSTSSVIPLLSTNFAASDDALERRVEWKRNFNNYNSTGRDRSNASRMRCKRLLTGWLRKSTRNAKQQLVPAGLISPPHFSELVFSNGESHCLCLPDVADCQQSLVEMSLKETFSYDGSSPVSSADYGGSSCTSDTNNSNYRRDVRSAGYHTQCGWDGARLGLRRRTCFNRRCFVCLEEHAAIVIQEASSHLACSADTVMALQTAAASCIEEASTSGLAVAEELATGCHHSSCGRLVVQSDKRSSWIAAEQLRPVRMLERLMDSHKFTRMVKGLDPSVASFIWWSLIPL